MLDDLRCSDCKKNNIIVYRGDKYYCAKCYTKYLKQLHPTIKQTIFRGAMNG